VNFYETLQQRAEALGIAVRGACHLAPGEFEGLLPGSSVTRTFVLFGFTGSLQWPHYARAVEAHDGAPHPLDRWSRRILGTLAAAFGALELYPSDTPVLPFQQLAARCESVHPSPIGLLIHPQWGLWHAYRGALLLPDRREIPAVAPSAHPCETCVGKPCLVTCPVGAFTTRGFDVHVCADFLGRQPSALCHDSGCMARRACPVGAQFRYLSHQARFHMAAFLQTGPR
jgi:hypothetical protein